jgi:hypothetical protein
MKVEVKKLAEEFKPVTVTVTITFEDREELFGHMGVGFVTRMDACREDGGGNYMSSDPTCRAIREALKEAGY